MKKCRVCGVEKAKESFYKGLAQCKDCYKKKVKKYRLENYEKIQAYEKIRNSKPHRVEARKNYAKTEKGKIAGNIAKKNWSTRNSIKRAASYMVGNAIRDGKIIKPKACESCGSKPERLHGHHDDYAFPLSVRWLCPGCHNKWHKENGPGLNAE